MWRNLTNNKKYVGSGVDLKERLRFYFNSGSLKSELLRSKSQIYSALLNYGSQNFSLEILEYCLPEQCIEREDFYIQIISPEYNICRKAGSSFGRLDSEETKAKKSAAAKRRLIPAIAGFQVQVTDLETDRTTTYNSIRAAAVALNSDIKTILRREQNNIIKPYRKRYIINIVRG